MHLDFEKVVVPKGNHHRWKELSVWKGIGSEKGKKA